MQEILKNDRTLEVTVQKLIDAVNLHYNVDRVIADFGIRILGTKSSPDAIPGFPVSYDGDFGDGYLVGLAEPYTTYIWTATNPERTEGVWLNIGLLATVGPQGPQGIQGEKGDPGASTSWTFSPSAPASPNIGDYWLKQNAELTLYVYGTRGTVTGWWTVGNLKGETGAPGANGLTPTISDGYWYIGSTNTGVKAEGKDGANGLPGSALTVVGTLASVDLLPDPATAPRQNAYLIKVNNDDRLYFIAGTDSLSWQYIIFDGSGTIVTKDGVGLDTWDVNSVVPMPDVQPGIANDLDMSYAALAFQHQYFPPRTNMVLLQINRTRWLEAYPIEQPPEPDNNTIAAYRNGRLPVQPPEYSFDAASKQYVDDSLSPYLLKYTSQTDAKQLYAVFSSGNQYMQPLMSSATAGTAVLRDNLGGIKALMPSSGVLQNAGGQYVVTYSHFMTNKAPSWHNTILTYAKPTRTRLWLYDTVMLSTDGRPPEAGGTFVASVNELMIEVDRYIQTTSVSDLITGETGSNINISAELANGNVNGSSQNASIMGTMLYNGATSDHDYICGTFRKINEDDGTYTAEEICGRVYEYGSARVQYWY